MLRQLRLEPFAFGTNHRDPLAQRVGFAPKWQQPAQREAREVVAASLERQAGVLVEALRGPVEPGRVIRELLRLVIERRDTGALALQLEFGLSQVLEKLQQNANP